MGGENPTIETPGSPIESFDRSIEDERMGFLSDLLVDTLLHPVVLVSAAVTSVALVSGLVARLVQLLEDSLPRMRGALDAARTSGLARRHQAGKCCPTSSSLSVHNPSVVVSSSR